RPWLCGMMLQFQFNDRVALSSCNRLVIPTTSTMGFFNGSGVGAVRDSVRSSVQKAFANRGFTSEIFIVVGENWAWGGATT
ncbi:hypothetical protein V1971_34120, partial [Pseudomonas aeruginosa]